MKIQNVALFKAPTEQREGDKYFVLTVHCSVGNRRYWLIATDELFIIFSELYAKCTSFENSQNIFDAGAGPEPDTIIKISRTRIWVKNTTSIKNSVKNK